MFTILPETLKEISAGKLSVKRLKVLITLLIGCSTIVLAANFKNVIFNVAGTPSISKSAVYLPDNGGEPRSNNLQHVIADTCKLNNVYANANPSDGKFRGTVTFLVYSGTAPYRFTLNGVTNNTGYFTGLNGGNYNYTVTDANGCIASGTVVIADVISRPMSEAFRDTILAAAAGCLATLDWNDPSLLYPDTIDTAPWTTPGRGKLIYKGTYKGHGYFVSAGNYKWNEARPLTRGISGHLVTITDAGENDFIYQHFRQVNNYGPWIGLYNTGTPGSFAWDTDEPVTYTNWNAGEPNNQGGSATRITEGYVHIMGYDYLNRWNDVGDMSLPFITEVDNPIFTYKQIGGPERGSARGPGTYTICYERVNALSALKDTSCFTVTVICKPVTTFCQKDTAIIADPVTCLGKVAWTEPEQGFTDSIKITGGTASGSQLRLKGMYKGNAYYLSDSAFQWGVAKNMAAAAGGHLVTITDSAENDFIYQHFRQTNNYGPWIGLYNTGTPGNFAWVTGEPLNFTNWNINEPNNYKGTATDITEPYIHIMGYDYLNRWNDMTDVPLRFIAEFENPKFSFTQIAGPANGSDQRPGLYSICYERINRVTSQKDTCCFTITVNCATVTGNQPNNPVDPNLSVKRLQGNVFPNPSTNSFSLVIQSDNTNDRVSVRVINIHGQILEVREAVVPNTRVSIGGTYRPGVYFVQVMQKKRKIVFKLIKQ